MSQIVIYQSFHSSSPQHWTRTEYLKLTDNLWYFLTFNLSKKSNFIGCFEGGIIPFIYNSARA